MAPTNIALLTKGPDPEKKVLNPIIYNYNMKKKIIIIIIIIISKK